MAGLDRAIYALLDPQTKTWMPGKRPGMTKEPTFRNSTHDNQV